MKKLGLNVQELKAISYSSFDGSRIERGVEQVLRPRKSDVVENLQIIRFNRAEKTLQHFFHLHVHVCLIGASLIAPGHETLAVWRVHLNAKEAALRVLEEIFVGECRRIYMQKTLRNA